MSVSKAKNIDIQNLYLLNMPAKLFIAGLAIAGVLAIGYVGIFKEQLETLSTQEAKEAELKETYTKKSIEAVNLHNLQEELASIRSACLRLDSVVPQAPVNDGPIQKLPYEISITGKHNQISQFARDVGGLSRIITLESLKLSQAADGKSGKEGKSDILTLSATATTYKARPAEEVAAELAAKQKEAQANGSDAQNGAEVDNK